MNYEENNVHWKVGDIVIHDCDAKRENMLMKVIEEHLTDDNQSRFICAYIDAEYHMGQKGFSKKEFDEWNRWDNSMKPLHDPKRFDIAVKS